MENKDGSKLFKKFARHLFLLERMERKIKMYIDKTLSTQLLEYFDFEETKRNISNYFLLLENLVWQWSKLNAQKGLIANYDYAEEFRKQPYTPIGKDIFGLSAKEFKEEEIKKYISSYYLAKSIMTEPEQLYIEEHFLKRKYEEEIVDLLGLESSDSREYRNLKRSAVYKFADFLDLVEEKKIVKVGMKK